MLELTLKEQFSVIVMNGQDTGRAGLAGQMNARGLVACDVLMDKLDLFDTDQAYDLLKDAAASAKKFPARDSLSVMQNMFDDLVQKGAMDIRPALLGCDMNNVEAGVSINSWYTDENVYRCTVEGFRSEMLDEDEPNSETALLYWLLKESCALNEMFSIQEQHEIDNKVTGFATKHSGWKAVCDVKFADSLSVLGLRFLKAKHSLFKNPYLEGVVLIFPFLERRTSIFIDLVVLGSSVKDRRNQVVDYLNKRGHRVSVVKNDSESLLLIDGAYYRIFPTTRRMYKVPVQGVALVPVYR